MWGILVLAIVFIIFISFAVDAPGFCFIGLLICFFVGLCNSEPRCETVEEKNIRSSRTFCDNNGGVVSEVISHNLITSNEVTFICKNGKTQTFKFQ